MTTPVIVLNGGSSAGKSSIARVLQEMLPGLWLTFGVDTFVEALPGKGDSPRAGIVHEQGGTISVDAGFRACEAAWYAGLNAVARAGVPLILDEVFLSGGVGQERLRLALDGSKFLWVGVHCHPDVAAARESRRPNRPTGMARQQALSVHAGVRYDLEVDTTVSSSEQCAQQIASIVHP